MENTVHTYYLIIAGFTVYFIVSYAFKILRIHNVEQALLTKNGILLINIKHLIGIIIFGLMFYAVLPQYRFLINKFEIPELYILLVFLSVLLISGLFAFKSVKKKIQNTTQASEYKLNKGWSYLITRVVFLLAYEFFFRGVLLFALMPTIGLAYAIVVCTSLYVLIHMFDQKLEILGAIPFGIILCLFSYLTNSIWIAFSVHIVLSTMYEFSLFKHLTRKV